MDEQRLPLSQLFSSVTRSMQENQAYLNNLDGSNGNAGDNSVRNWQIVEQAMRQAERRNQDAGFVLRRAAQALAEQGQGKQAQAYAQGLAAAAPQFEGRVGMSQDDFLPLMQGLLGGMQAQGLQPQALGVSGAAASPLDALLPGVLGYVAAKQRGMSNQDAILSALGQAANASGILGGGGPVGGPSGGLGSILGGLMSGGAGPVGGGPVGRRPSAGHAPPAGGGLGDILGGLLGGMGGAPQGGVPSRGRPTPDETPMGGGLGDILGALLGGMGGAPQGGAPSRGSSQGQTPPMGDLGDILGSLLGGMGGASTGSGSGFPQTPPAAQPDDQVLGRLESGPDQVLGSLSGGDQPAGGLLSDAQSSLQGISAPQSPDPGAVAGTAMLEGLMRAFSGDIPPQPSSRRRRS